MSLARLREGIAETDPMEAAARGFYAFVCWHNRATAAEVFGVRGRMGEVRRRIVECERANRLSLDDKRAVARECKVPMHGGAICPAEWADTDGPMWDVIRTWPEYQGVAK